MIVPDEFNGSWFAAYLANRSGHTVDVVEFTRFTRGTSRQTWFARYRDDNGEHQLTLRADHPAGAGDPTPLDREYECYRALGKTDIPHARALFWESDPAKTPRPFYTRELVDGSWQVPGFGTDSDEAKRIQLEASREHMRALAKVHDADWRAAGFGELFGAPADEAQAAPFYLELLMRRFDEFGGEPQPLMHEAHAFLRANAPSAARISLCKGTNGLGEEVFRDGQIVAMSDWEESIVGDPASDLAMVQGFTEAIEIEGETVWDHEMAVDYYNTQARVPVSMDNVRYYQLARLFGRMVMFAFTTNVVRRSPNATVRQGWTTTEPQHVVRRVMAHALGLGPPADPQLFEEMNESIDMFDEGEEA
ncbi:phosphotransferase family protein [Croceicoccus mobilis]|nr:phosphotransferase family protein [Croceicoccus mobilis]